MASFRNGSRCSDCTGETTVITRHIIKHSWRVAGSRAWQGTQRMWPGRRVPTHLVTRGARRGLKLVAERHVRLERASVRAQPPRRTPAPHTTSVYCNLAARKRTESAPAAPVTVFAECKGCRRDGGGARNADGGRSADRARGAAVPGRPARPEGHYLDETFRRRSPLPHHRQELTGTLRRLRRHRGSGRHHRQTNQQEQGLWICKNLSFFLLF